MILCGVYTLNFTNIQMNNYITVRNARKIV
jgi:hypothetical protein